MPVSFQELPDSPRVKIIAGKFSATRKFLVLWGDTIQFSVELLGGYYSAGSSIVYQPPLAFPGVPQAICRDATFDPFPEDRIEVPTSGSLTGSSNQPLYAMVTAEYRIDEYANGKSGQKNAPEFPDGTFLSVSTNIGSEMVTIPGRAFKWDGTDEKLPPDVTPGIMLSSEQVVCTWQRVPLKLVPRQTIRQQRGRLNASSFLGYPAGTLLFVGAREQAEFQMSGDVLTTLEYTFSAQSKPPTKSGQKEPLGWNYGWKEVASGDEHWVKIVSADDGKPPFREDGDFQSLFVFDGT